MPEPRAEPLAAGAAALAEVVDVRVRRWRPQVAAALVRTHPDDPELIERVLAQARRAALARPAALQQRDRLREVEPDWFQHESMVGYVTYVDRFAGRIDRIAGHLDHLEGLGVTYLHLMPLLAARPHPNDGGYAVVDYDAVEPALGTMADLEELAATLHDRGMVLCVDLVVNHTAAEHAWARRARAGEERYLRYYRTYATREVPDAYERTLPDVFPDTAPGNFTYDEDLGRWVWTTFNPWQWDLDWSNPEVVEEILGVVLRLADRGVDVVRLDAVPFLWKRLGTACQNLPEVHLLLQALRALLAIAAPATIVKGEAIVAPGDLVPYQGVGRRTTTECDLLYHNQLMVQGWSALAAQDGRLATIALSRMAETPAHASWVTYVRCHDDIGWAIDDGAAAERGWDGPSHRRFLSSFYAGEVGFSYAEGAHFQEDFVSGDRRTSGTSAAMVGVTRARRDGDPAALERAIDRLVLLHALAASYGGIPLLYMGDEVALGNDRSYLADPDRAADNRWMHRPAMDWAAAARRAEAGSVEARVYDALAHLMRVRAGLPTLRAGGRVTPRWHDVDQVLAFRRDHPRTGRFLGLANFSTDVRLVDAAAVGLHELEDPLEALQGGPDRPHPPVAGGRIRVPALRMLWLTER
jgi:amylosucrase